MDQATRRLRAQNKREAAARREGDFSSVAVRGLGRKNKRADSFPVSQCQHEVGGRMFYFKRRRKNRKPGESEFVNGAIRKGGRRCINVALGKRDGRAYCADHLHVIGESLAKGVDEMDVIETSPRSGIGHSIPR